MTAILNYTDPHKTVRRALPYRIQKLINGKAAITNLKGQTLIVSRGEIENQLQREDLDVHRRRMYEAALAEIKQAVQ